MQPYTKAEAGRGSARHKSEGGAFRMSVFVDQSAALDEKNSVAEEERLRPRAQSFWRRSWLQLSVGAAALGAIALGVFLLLFRDTTPPPRQVRELTVINIVPPPPPPPPPLPQEKMIEQPKMVTPEIKQPDKPDDKPLEKPKVDNAKDEPPPGPLALDAKAEGPGDAFGLAGKPGGQGLLGSGGGGGGSLWGWYGNTVQKAIERAFDANAKTRFAVMDILVRIWIDRNAHVTRVLLAGSSGDPEVDAALRNSVLPSISLSEPPPSDMPMPIVIKMIARRAS
jgi:periplasmic protein TonB